MKDLRLLYLSVDKDKDDGGDLPADEPPTTPTPKG